MALLRGEKIALAQTYVELMNGGQNVVVFQYANLSVNDLNATRMDVAAQGGKIKIVKKRVFLKGVESEYAGLGMDDMSGSVAILVSTNEEDEHAPLKAFQKKVKAWKKEKKACEVSYVGGRYDKTWENAEYVTELANLPSKEELVGKFLFLLNHPMSSFARVLNAIGEKDGEEVFETVAAEEPVTEEVQA